MASNDTAPNQKRRRESDAELKRDREVWLEDGNVVLACESTVFRVHRSVLAAHCEVFKNMFTVYNEDSEADVGVSATFCQLGSWEQLQT